MMPYSSLGRKFCAVYFIGSLVFNILSFYFLCWSPDPTNEKGGYKLHKTNSYVMVVLVMSAPSNSDRRQTVRETWGRQLSEKQCLVRFVLGLQDIARDLEAKVLDEQQTFHDLLILPNFEDSYFTLTSKLLESLYLIEDRYTADYVMKCDDDTFIYSSHFLHKLQQLPQSSLYWGYFTGAARIKKSGQWAEPNFHLCDRYLPYARGGGYLVSWDIVQYINRNRLILQSYNSEDVSMGVWLAPLNITRIHDTGFDTEATSRGCSNHHFVSHKQSSEDMYRKQRTIDKYNRLCDRELTLTKEYTYNWDVPPSQCCIRNPP